MVCTTCQYVYNVSEYPAGCPSCLKHKEVVLARALEMVAEENRKRREEIRCALSDCVHIEHLLGLCAAHWAIFCKAPEAARMRTAVGDYVRRVDTEARVARELIDKSASAE